MGDMKRRVLILCTGNSARSQMAEAIINAQRGETWHAYSAGTNPAPRVHPMALKALAEIGIQTEGTPPKHIDSFAGEAFDAVLTVCDDAAENCPFWSGQGQRIHIGFPDPAKPTGSEEDVLAAFRAVRDDIGRRVLDTLDTVVMRDE
jgi:arsenate reductase (thioredoxin)